MIAIFQARRAKALRVFCPIEARALAEATAGDASALERDPTLSKMLSIIREDNPLGDFGTYKSVVELAPGWELFIPAAAANPALGKAGSRSTSPTAILTLYVADDVSPDSMTRAVNQIMNAHPWEMPVIELTDTLLLTRAENRTQL